MEELVHSVPVWFWPAKSRPDCLPHDLHVLFRHRPRSIALKPPGPHCQGRQEYLGFPTIALTLPPLRIAA
jgi:hypothetical protein